jgi:hypothetical protein
MKGIKYVYSSQVSSMKQEPEESAIFYDIGFRPAVQSASPTIIHDWPPSYSSETFQASNPRGGFTETSHVLSADDVAQFSMALKRHMGTVSWGKDIVFGTEIRGVKNTTEHRFDSEFSPQVCLEDLLSEIKEPYEELQGHWFIDVAIELIIRNKAVVWRADSYPPLMMQLFQIPEETVDCVSRHRYHLNKIFHNISLKWLASRLSFQSQQDHTK